MEVSVGALPAELARQSLSQAAIILPLDAALEAVAHLTRNGHRLESWEGWVKLRDGNRARSLTHGGSFALSPDPARAADVASSAMRRAQEYWQRNPEYPGCELYYGLAFGPATAT